jgi:ferric-dicitrate binding protein FerR (iron transport regulator)
MSSSGGDCIGCADFRRTLRPDRRTFVKAGILGSAGLALSGLLLMTLYRHLGVDTEAQYTDGSGRPITVLPDGQPIEELM